MSVEEAREELLAAGWAWHGDQDKVEPKIDRLILEVQAEVPCTDRDWPCPNCTEVFCTKHLCIGCTARMKLKETADEPLPGTRAD